MDFSFWYKLWNIFLNCDSFSVFSKRTMPRVRVNNKSSILSCANCKTELGGFHAGNPVKTLRYSRGTTTNFMFEEETYTKSIYDSLSIVYSMIFKSARIFPSISFWKKHDDCSVCINCARAMVNLCKAFQDFSDLSNENSYISKGVQRFFDELHKAEGRLKSVESVETPKRNSTYNTRNGSRKETKDSMDWQGSTPESILLDEDDGDDDSDPLENNRRVKTEVFNVEDNERDPFLEESQNQQKRKSPRKRGHPKFTSKKRLKKDSSVSDSDEDDAEPEDYHNNQSSKKSDPDFHPNIDNGFRSRKSRSLNRDKDTDKCDSQFVTCPDCPAALSNIFSLRRHMLSVHGKLRRWDKVTKTLVVKEQGEESTCDLCKQTFCRTDEFEKHIRTHTACEKGYICSLCPFKCISKNKLKRHLRQAHDSNDDVSQDDFKCGACKSSFDTLLLLQNHLEAEHGERFVPCTLCQAKFAGNAYLEEHRKQFHSKNNNDEIEDDE